VVFFFLTLSAMKILMVCLGNICRSPLAEGILRQKSALRNIKITIDSCGTSDYHIGEAPDKRSQANALKNGVDISGLRARQFSRDDFENFDLILTMDQSNFNNVIALARSDSQRQKVKMILNISHPGSNRAVPDPYFGGPDGFQEVFNLLDQACEKILDNFEKRQ
jgi:protein-tyrosine phosphatase